jgi:hypothetical protein
MKTKTVNIFSLVLFIIIALYFCVPARADTLDGVVALDNANDLFASGYVAGVRDSHFYWLIAGETQATMTDVSNGYDLCQLRGAWSTDTIIATARAHLRANKFPGDTLFWIWYRKDYTTLVCPELYTAFNE